MIKIWLQTHTKIYFTKNIDCIDLKSSVQNAPHNKIEKIYTFEK